MADKSKERLELEVRATALGLKFPANIGDAKLAKRIEKHQADTQANAANEGAIDGGSQPQTGAAPEAAPTDPVTRTQGGGLAEAQAPVPQTNTNTPPPEPATTGAAETAAASETPEGGEGGITRGAPKSASVSGSPPPLTGAQVSITGPKRGRWRAGFHFTAEPRLFTVSELTDDEIAAISLDDKLTVTFVE